MEESSVPAKRSFIQRLQFDQIASICLFLEVSSIRSFLSTSKRLDAFWQDEILWILLTERDFSIQQGILRRSFREVLESVGVSSGSPAKVYQTLFGYRFFKLQGCYAINRTLDNPRGGLARLMVNGQGRLVLKSEIDIFELSLAEGGKCRGCRVCEGGGIGEDEVPIVWADGQLGLHGSSSTFLSITSQLSTVLDHPNYAVCRPSPDDAECGVCNQPFDADLDDTDEENCLRLDCRHFFHGECLHKRSECPVCGDGEDGPFAPSELSQVLRLPGLCEEVIMRRLDHTAEGPPNYLRLHRLNRLLVCGIYNVHGPEILQISVKPVSGGRQWIFQGDKVSGDQNVPAGHTSFRSLLTVVSGQQSAQEEVSDVSGHIDAWPIVTSYARWAAPVAVDLRTRITRIETIFAHAKHQINMVPGTWTPQFDRCEIVVYKPGDELVLSVIWSRIIIDFSLVTVEQEGAFCWSPRV